MTKGIASKPCEYTMAGMSELYLFNHSEVTFTDSDSDNIYDTITMSSTSGKMYKFVFEKETASFNQELQVGNGNRFFNQTLTFTVRGDSQEITDIMEILGLATVGGIGKTSNGKYKILGKGLGLEASALTNNTGAAKGDASGYIVTLSGGEIGLAPELEAGTVIPL